MIDKEKLSLGEYDPQARAHLDGIIRGAVSGARTMDDVLDAGLRELFEAMLPKDVAADMCAAVSRLGEYTHEEGIYRRSYRSRDPADYFDRLDEMAAEIYSDWGGFDILARIRGEEARQSADDRGPPSSSTVSMLAALRIDRGDEAVIGTVRDTILSDNNARSVGHELIRGVAMSHNAELHGLMRDLLLAARLQEGLRQAILETADDGTLDYFKMMIGAVLENNLLRYSSALRAVGVYMGLGYDYSDRRAVERLLRLAYSYMEDDAGREAAIGSKDSVQMYAGMWAESVFSIQGLNARIEKCFQGDKHQRMVAACFLSEAGSKENGVRLAGGALDETDMDALALIFESYKLGLSDVSDNYWGPDDEMEVAQDRYPRALRDGAARDRHFNRLAEVIGTIPKSGHTVDGKPFDWCLSTMTRGDVYGTMMVLAAYDFDEGKQRRLMELFHLAESQNKVDFLSFFISREINGGGFEGVSRDFLFGCLSEKSMPARIRAAELVKRLTLDEGETAIVEGLLSLKTGEMRQTALEVIMGAGPAAALSSARRLIADRDENKRLAALDILSWAKRSGEVSPEALSELLSSMPAVTGAEAILVAGLEDDTPADHSPENGFGLYDPSYLPEFPPIERDGRYDLKAFRGIGAKDMTRVFDSLRALVEEHEGHAYRAVFGFGVIDHMEDEALLLSAGSPMADTEDSILGDQEFLQIVTPFAADAGPRIEDYALGDVWRGWFEENRGDLLAIVKVFYACEVSDWEDEYRPEYKPFVNDLIKKHLGYGEIKEFLAKERSKKHYYLAKDIIRILVSRAAEGTDVFPIFHGILADFFLSVPKEDWARPCEAVDELGLGLSTRLADTDELRTLIYGMKASAPLAVERLALCYAIGGASGDRYVGLSVEDVARAFADGAVGRGELRRAVMEIGGGEAIGSYTGPLYYHRTAEIAARYPALMECVGEVVARVIEIELKRGDTRTPVSGLAKAVRRHEGAGTFAEILVALGKETLTRGYTYGDDCTKRDVLSSLLKSCVPAPGDDASTLKAALRDRVPEKRLLEAAMYAPAWIPIIEDLLGWTGLRSAAWYFHAHTRDSYIPIVTSGTVGMGFYAHTGDSYSVDFETEVARFSPIERGDFQRGAFDIDWFREAYGALGAERFDMLYDCAKYISNGAAHRRAQLFADAALGKLSLDDLEKQVRDKRNKDLLLSYGLVPPSRDRARDALRRYDFINEFLRESRNFGSQRQASEKEAAEVALDNLAHNMGYADAQRFGWRMEMEKADSVRKYFTPRVVGDVTLSLEMDDAGQAALAVAKGGKRLGSVPAAVKKDAYVKEINDAKASLKAQFSRARRSLENAMEGRDAFTMGEVSMLGGHPVIGPMLGRLVLKCGGELGLPDGDALRRHDGSLYVPGEDAALTIAHCYDLFASGGWTDWQRHAFENGLVQPFKQIFRELYTVNEDERSEKTVSRRYAGNQVQPRKAAALLKGRGWTVDYDEGLQKVRHKENVVVSMRALADWFSPSDVEAPTLEAVVFSDRRTGRPLEIGALDPVLFSEVMRDIDLAVSVAHVGGVDPMASHSTVEMRAVIVAESARLMKLGNVAVDGRHARIAGSMGDYSVHLGSGQAHMTGHGALNILPVHSQHRGRLFLPFLDEDPKTAEIVAKVLLLAEDGKIKDPTVAAQIRG